MVENKTLTGERAEYFAKDVSYSNCTFKDGESPLKHAENINVEKSVFEYKYPLWHSANVNVDNSKFMELGKSGLWYVDGFSLKNTKVIAPKEFRRGKNINLENVVFENALETLWTCENVQLKNVQVFNGDYFAMNCCNFKAENLELNGNYFLDGGKNIEIRNSVLNSKDAFWNCQNVVVYDSYINGEYLGWNSKNLKFVNCRIESNQGLCYIDGLVLENCTFENTDLAFEYSSNIDAKIKGSIISVKNPASGKICADEIQTLILNPKRCDPSKTVIICPHIGDNLSTDPNPNE